MSDWPTVTIIVLNYNGRKHLEDCFSSLTKLDYPRDRLELMLVDNASSDGSVEYIKNEYPHVKVVQENENVGFAAGNNAGARAASGQYVVFLNNDMWVEPHFVRGLVEAIQSDPQIVCAGAKILNWDWTRYDFAGGAVHFSGNAFQIGLNQPFRTDAFTDIKPMCFACGGAMLVDRQLFLDIGGFDEDYFIYFEDVDFGWRLWVLGYEVVFAPAAVVNHCHHGTMEAFADFRKQVVYKRNSLYTIIKNYSDENLGRILPAVLMGTVGGMAEQMIQKGQLVPEEFFYQELCQNGTGQNCAYETRCQYARSHPRCGSVSATPHGETSFCPVPSTAVRRSNCPIFPPNLPVLA
jgi:GT2 family glycosyltransferase